MTTGATLLELLEFADGEQLLLLLDAEILLWVLERHGRDRAQVRRELDGGRSAGELLLSLFREGHKAADLIAQLPPGVVERAKAQQAMRRAAASAAAPDVGRGTPGPSSGARLATPPTPRSLDAPTLPAAFIAYLVALVVPSMLVAGLFPEWTIGIWIGVAVAALGAGGAGLFASNAWPLRIAGAIAGVLSAPGAVLLTALWLAVRGSVLRIELALTIILGALPGMLFFWLAATLYALFQERSSKNPSG